MPLDYRFAPRDWRSGNSIILDLYGEIVKSHGEGDRRFRMNMRSIWRPKGFDRFAQLHVIASSSPITLLTMALAEQTHRPDACQPHLRVPYLLEHGVRLAFVRIGT